MLLADVDVLTNANRVDADRHQDFRDWVSKMVNGDEPSPSPTL